MHTSAGSPSVVCCRQYVCLVYLDVHVLLSIGVLGAFLRKWCLAPQHSLEQKMLGISWIVSGR